MRSSRHVILSCLLTALPLVASADCPADQAKLGAPQTQKPQADETITSDIVLSADSQARSVESFSGAITVHRGARVAGNAGLAQDLNPIERAEQAPQFTAGQRLIVNDQRFHRFCGIRMRVVATVPGG